MKVEVLSPLSNISGEWSRWGFAVFEVDHVKSRYQFKTSEPVADQIAQIVIANKAPQLGKQIDNVWKLAISAALGIRDLALSDRRNLEYAVAYALMLKNGEDLGAILDHPHLLSEKLVGAKLLFKYFGSVKDISGTEKWN